MILWAISKSLQFIYCIFWRYGSKLLLFSINFVTFQDCRMVLLCNFYLCRIIQNISVKIACFAFSFVLFVDIMLSSEYPVYIQKMCCHKAATEERKNIERAALKFWKPELIMLFLVLHAVLLFYSFIIKHTYFNENLIGFVPF